MSINAIPSSNPENNDVPHKGWLYEGAFKSDEWTTVGTKDLQIVLECLAMRRPVDLKEQDAINRVRRAAFRIVNTE